MVSTECDEQKQQSKSRRVVYATTTTTAMEHANLGGNAPFASVTGGGGVVATVRIRRKYLASRGQIAEKLSALFGVRLGPELSSVEELGGSYATFQVSSGDQSGSVVDAAGVNELQTGDIAVPVTRSVVGVVTMSGDLINQIQVRNVV